MMNAINSDESSRRPPVPWKLSGALADLERDGESEFVRDLIDTFLRDTATRLESMRKAAAAADLDALAACSHTLKGSTLLMNADRLAELCCETSGKPRQRTIGIISRWSINWNWFSGRLARP